MRQPELESFLAEHSTIIETALRLYAVHQRKEGEKLHESYELIKDNAQARALQDQSLITTHGLRTAGSMLKEAAERADRARRDLAALTEADDEDDAA